MNEERELSIRTVTLETWTMTRRLRKTLVQCVEPGEMFPAGEDEPQVVPKDVLTGNKDQSSEDQTNE